MIEQAMRYLLLIAFSFLISCKGGNDSSESPEAPKIEEVREEIKSAELKGLDFLNLIKEGKYGEAAESVDSIYRPSEEYVRKFSEGMLDLHKGLGELHSSRLVNANFVDPSLLKITYISRYENSFLLWNFVFYRHQEDADWKMMEYRADYRMLPSS